MEPLPVFQHVLGDNGGLKGAGELGGHEDGNGFISVLHQGLKGVAVLLRVDLGGLGEGLGLGLLGVKLLFINVYTVGENAVLKNHAHVNQVNV